MIPIIKKSGRTVFGVRIGLKNGFSSEDSLFGMKGPTAKLSIAAAGMRYLNITMSFDEEKEHTK